jgi:hypothetical protein
VSRARVETAHERGAGNLAGAGAAIGLGQKPWQAGT